MKFHHHYDLLVVGGGVAGCAAALSAGRAGLKVALVEKTIQWGGLATSGLVNTYLPLCDGKGRQVFFGIAEEFFHLSLRYGPGDIPPGWEHPLPARHAGARALEQRFMNRFIPASLALSLDEVLLEAGVTLWLDSLACDPLLDGSRLCGVEVETAGCRGSLTAACTIDSTGDASLLHRAGAECVNGENWLTSWVMQYSETALERAREQPSPNSLVTAFNLRLGASDDGRNAIPGYPRLSGVQPGDTTRYAMESRRIMREYYSQIYSGNSGANRNTIFPLTLPSMAQFRTIRHIVGQETMQTGHVNTDLPNSVGLAADWRVCGSIWPVPFGSLLPKGLTGALAAGRCISTDWEGWQVARSIPAAALTGQIAAIAARLSLETQLPLEQLPIEKIQAALRQAGIVYQFSQLNG